MRPPGSWSRSTSDKLSGAANLTAFCGCRLVAFYNQAPSGRYPSVRCKKHRSSLVDAKSDTTGYEWDAKSPQPCALVNCPPAPSSGIYTRILHATPQTLPLGLGACCAGSGQAKLITMRFPMVCLLLCYGQSVAHADTFYRSVASGETTRMHYKSWDRNCVSRSGTVKVPPTPRTEN